jgi:hypothetical protein
VFFTYNFWWENHDLENQKCFTCLEMESKCFTVPLKSETWEINRSPHQRRQLNILKHWNFACATAWHTMRSKRRNKHSMLHDHIRPSYVESLNMSAYITAERNVLWSEYD